MIRIIYTELFCTYRVHVKIGDLELEASRVAGASYIHKRDAERRIREIKEACESENLRYVVEYVHL